MTRAGSGSSTDPRTRRWPSLDQLTELPASTTFLVPPTYVDVNGHLNVVECFRMAAVEIGAVYEGLGLGESYREEREQTLFVTEQRLRYLCESLLGEELSIRVRLIERTERSLHAIVYVVNHDRARIAYVMETMLTHVSLADRRAVDYPADIAAILDAAIEAQPPLSWDLRDQTRLSFEAVG